MGYILRANTGPVYVEIRRTEDSLSDPRPFLNGLDETQRTAFEQAIQHAKQANGQEAVLVALRQGFENVSEKEI